MTTTQTDANMPTTQTETTNTQPGARAYNPLILATYDNWVLRFNMSYVWRCPTSTILLPLFREAFSTRHLDIGVASGYFPSAALQQSKLAANAGQHEITLMDLNEGSCEGEDRA
ncbi:hypothetical protein B0T16DRAFT_408174 [Cercophora newfieldiana]|uniref:Uncharacterized protein n=1 Tax=Cercophora newfieldiana TaxID=92897 RepID=A0AA40CRD3_9PEZI|nr:hypothetical protein B0T16DRAFT_408174 [Cercophora newfieldiana]